MNSFDLMHFNDFKIPYTFMVQPINTILRELNNDRFFSSWDSDGTFSRRGVLKV